MWGVLDRRQGRGCSEEQKMPCHVYYTGRSMLLLLLFLPRKMKHLVGIPEAPKKKSPIPVQQELYSHTKGNKEIQNGNQTTDITACCETYRRRLPLERFHQDVVRDDGGVEDPYLKDSVFPCFPHYFPAPCFVASESLLAHPVPACGCYATRSGPPCDC